MKDKVKQHESKILLFEKVIMKREVKLAKAALQNQDNEQEMKA